MRRLVPGIGMLLATLALPSAADPVRAQGDVAYEEILTGYDRPIHIASVPGNDRVLYIAEQGGRIRRARLRDGVWRKAGLFLDISDRVNVPTGFIEQGVLGMTFHPKYRRNGLLYVAYTRKTGDERDGDSVVSEFRRGPDGRADPASERVVIVVRQPKSLHSVASLVFGPDGMLYIGSGDGGRGKDAQDLTIRRGKILRIDPRDPDRRGPKRFRIPPDNPYVGRRGADVIWASGLRNPWRFSFDRETGDLWIGDVGEQRTEEIDLGKANRAGRKAARGRDYGWNACEGSLELRQNEGDPDTRCDHGTLPLYEYEHGDGRCAIIGGHVYRGPGARTWRGKYIAADSCGTQFVLDRRGRELIARRIQGGIVSFGEDALGNLYAVHWSAGLIYRVRLVGRLD